jgi:ABC-type branched-subunit amino acid transport system ATPase component
MSRLQLEQIDAAYRKKTVLREVTLAAEPGEIVALIGPNGAGKSTVLKVAAGLLAPQKGRVQLEDRDITGLPAHERVDRGLAYCIQGGRVFPSLTVRENLAMGAGALSADERADGTAAVLDVFPVLKDLLERRAGLLSGGERQALALGMVLVRRPQVLLLDEPSAGLAPRLVRDLLDTVRALNEDWDLSILLVEQNVRAALRIANRALALENGSVTRTTEAPGIWLDGKEMEELFLGGRMDTNSHAPSQSNQINTRNYETRK